MEGVAPVSSLKPKDATDLSGGKTNAQRFGRDYDELADFYQNEPLHDPEEWMEKLMARIEKAGSSKQGLEEDVAELTAQIADMNKADAEATKIRNEEHAEFMKADMDFSNAAEAVDDAIDALKEYYGDTSFLQTDSETGDEIFGSDSDSESTATTHRSAEMQPALGGARTDTAGGIIGILETMGEEFRKTVKENQATEREALKAFEKLMNENKVATATKEAEIKGAESQIKALDVSIHDSGEDLKMANKEKTAIEDTSKVATNEQTNRLDMLFQSRHALFIDYLLN